MVGVHDEDCSVGSEAPSGAGLASLKTGVLASEHGEARLAEHAVTVRCLTRPDGSLPDSSDEPDLIAWIGRSY